MIFTNFMTQQRSTSEFIFNFVDWVVLHLLANESHFKYTEYDCTRDPKWTTAPGEHAKRWIKDPLGQTSALGYLQNLTTCVSLPRYCYIVAPSLDSHKTEQTARRQTSVPTRVKTFTILGLIVVDWALFPHQIKHKLCLDEELCRPNRNESS